MREHLAEIDAIGDASPGRRASTTPWPRSTAAGRLFDRIDGLFYNLTSSETSPALQAVEREMAPLLAAHDSRVYMHRALFARIDALHRRRHELGLGDEQLSRARALSHRLRARRRAHGGRRRRSAMPR